MALEGAGNGSGSVISTQQLPYSASQAPYRVNIQLNEYSGSGPGQTNKMILCDKNGNVVLNATVTGPTTAYPINGLELGITGEEPATAGYYYWWDDVVVSLSGEFSSTACIL